MTILTTDPVVAAGVRQGPDFDLMFPGGRRWRIADAPRNCLSLYAESRQCDGLFGIFHNDRRANSLGDLSEHELAILYFDLRYFAFNRDQRWWSPQQRGRELEAYLRPGREDWGTALWLDPEEEAWQ